MRVNIALCFLTTGLFIAVSAQNPILAEQSTTETTETTSKNCITSRGDGGSCVGRNRCDYGTQYIDFTLYVPHGYIKQCLEDEVCCPPNFVTPEPERLFTPSDDYDFDDDD
ncbi:uncharacterized protein LOC106713417 isoform X2 [Papilio machaon]|uniref:uncharacterized protein LOC106713417 isoform X2 n=1 Tax=Papilio machaon TaxID=76193 RepID=UPI001E663D23|nr:uncharacterized protein LOC106713417 isoform X2 [Papilio machaon]